MINILADINSIPGSGGTIPVSVIYEAAPVSGISAAHTDNSWIDIEATGIYPPTGAVDHTITYTITIDPNTDDYREGSVVFRYTDVSGQSYTAYLFIHQGTNDVIKASIYKDMFFRVDYNLLQYSIVHNGQTIFNGKVYRYQDGGDTFINVSKIARDYIYQSLDDFREVEDDIVVNEGGYGIFSLINEFGAALANYEFLYQYDNNWSGETEYMMTEPVNGHLDVRMKMMATIYNSGETTIEYNITDQPAYDPGSYLTFTILTPGIFNTQTPRDASYNPIAYYRINGGEWLTDYSTEGTEVVPGDIIEFKGYWKSWSSPGLGGGSCTYNVSGNLMSVVNGDNFSGLTDASDCSFGGFFQSQTNLISAEHLGLPATVLSDGCYQLMFSGCTGMTSGPVVLPATELTEGCYKEMFMSCNSLTKTPVLPATTLAEDCYNGMFWDCGSLTTAPVLPATTLAVGCYENMFDGCGSLVNIPDLPATILPSRCYSNMFVWCNSITSPPIMNITTAGDSSCYCMFAGCTALTSAPVLSATTVGYHCYEGMFQDCTSLTTAPVLPATVLGEGCYDIMFAGCTSLTTAPDLPADELVDSCYFGMFSDCTSLNYVKCLATYMDDDNCTVDWLQNVSSSGTFVKSSSMSSWTTGDDGIPANWTVINA